MKSQCFCEFGGVFVNSRCSPGKEKAKTCKDLVPKYTLDKTEELEVPKRNPVYGQNGVDLSFSPCFAC